MLLMRKIKSFLYLNFKKAGFEELYLKILFHFRNTFGIISLQEERLIDFYSGILTNKNSLIFDIGANVGVKSSVFSKLSKQVVAVEPNKKLANILNSRFKNSNVTVLNKGCSNSNLPLELMIPQNHFQSTFSNQFISHKLNYKNEMNWDKKVLVECITLDQLIMKYGVPDYCKIDVEGFELAVIEGLNQRIGMISFELNFPTFFKDSILILKKLNKLGYKEFNFSMGESLEFKNQSWMSEKEIISYLQDNFPTGKSFYGDIYAR